LREYGRGRILQLEVTDAPLAAVGVPEIEPLALSDRPAANAPLLID
jgi:hypothetical protein